MQSLGRHRGPGCGCQWLGERRYEQCPGAQTRYNRAAEGLGKSFRSRIGGGNGVWIVGAEQSRLSRALEFKRALPLCKGANVIGQRRSRGAATSSPLLRPVECRQAYSSVVPVFWNGKLTYSFDVVTCFAMKHSLVLWDAPSHHRTFERSTSDQVRS